MNYKRAIYPAYKIDGREYTSDDKSSKIALDRNEGKYLILLNNIPYKTGNVLKPYMASISNNARFVILSFGDDDINLEHLLVFEGSGKRLFKRKNKEGFITCSISPDGKYLATLESNFSKGSILKLLNVETKKELFREYHIPYTEQIEIHTENFEIKCSTRKYISETEYKEFYHVINYDSPIYGLNN